MDHSGFSLDFFVNSHFNSEKYGFHQHACIAISEFLVYNLMGTHCYQLEYGAD